MGTLLKFPRPQPQEPARFPFRLTTLVLAMLLAGQAFQTGCAATSRRSEPVAGQVDLSDPQLARGREVYSQHCDQCHPGGEGGLGPAINNKPLPAAMMRLQIRVGMGAMPAFPVERINDMDLDALVAYMMARKALTPDPAEVKSP
jgi:mono/diheme cytochrome c family protein